MERGSRRAGMASRGVLEWQRNGLGEPPAVKEANRKYRAEQDFLKPFLDECCDVGDDLTVSVGKLYEAAKKWMEESGEKEIRKVAFNEMMRERGFRDKPGTGNVYTWFGIGLKS